MRVTFMMVVVQVSIKRTTLRRLLEVLQERRGELSALAQAAAPVVARLLQELFQVGVLVGVLAPLWGVA